MRSQSDNIQDIICRKYADPEFNVQMLADEMGLSTTYVRELSWRNYGVSPYTLIENKRLEKALSLIHNEETNLHQICTQSGYQSPHTLRDACKRRFGETPADIRLKMHRKRDPQLIVRSYVDRLSNTSSASL